MTDRQLKYLVTLAEEGNMTAAAQKLFISQPSLSGLLSSVEAELETELFNRSTSPMTLTPAGERYVEAARKILSIKREMENQIHDLSGRRKSTLHVGCGTQLSAILYPRILPDFLRDCPQTKLKLVEDHFRGLCAQFERGELDLIMANRRMESPVAESALLYREEITLAAPASARLKASAVPGHGYPVADAGQLASLPFILVKAGQNLRRDIDRFFQEYQITPQIILETNNWETCYRMVEQNIGYTIIPYVPFFHLEAEKQIRRYSLPGLWYRDIRIYWHRQPEPSKALLHFIKLCRQAFSGVPLGPAPPSC